MSCCCNKVFRLFVWPARCFLLRNYTSSVLKPEEKENLMLAVRSLIEDRSKAVWLLRIKKCNADYSHSFSEAFCQVESITEDTDKPEAFPFAGLYLRGIRILMDYLAGRSLDLSLDEKSSLDILISFLANKKDVTERILKNSSFESKYEIQWTAALAHYLLRELAVDSDYLLDKYSPKREMLGPELEQLVGKNFGDTSIGHPEVWHGCADILIGQKHVQVDVKGESGEFEDELVDEEKDEEDSKEMVEVEQDNSLYHQESKIISEALVFGCLQKKRYPKLDTFSPTIGISKENVIFYFYDSENDILIESSIFDIFKMVMRERRVTFTYETILALWLTLNYRYLSTGVTKSMLDRNDYRTNFWEQMTSETRNIYKNMLRFENTREGICTDGVIKLSVGSKLYWNPERDIQVKLDASDIA